MSPLNALLSKNMRAMFVTFSTLHFEMSLSKAGVLENTAITRVHVHVRIHVWGKEQQKLAKEQKIRKESKVHVYTGQYNC